MFVQLLSRLLKLLRPAQTTSLDELMQNAYLAHAEGNSTRAEQLCREVISRNTNQQDANLLLARIFTERASYQKAKEVLQCLLASSPNDAAALATLGNVCRMAGENDSAAEKYAASLAVNPRQPLTLLNYGRLLIDLGKVTEGETYLRTAIDLQHDLTEALTLLVPKLLDQGQTDTALYLLERAAARRPSDPDILNGLGFAWQRASRPEKALAYYRQAIALNPSKDEIWDNQGTALQDTLQLDKAIASFNKALELRPDHPIPRWHRSLTYLLKHNFEQGWPDYELRLFPNQTLPPRSFPYPRWQGESLRGKTILIYAEQGLGDEIMFASCLPDIAVQADHCIVECARKLGPLFARSFPTATVHAGNPDESRDWLTNIPAIDYQIPIGSLPLHFRSRKDTFPKHQGYFKADPVLIARWRRKLADLGPGFKIGLSWRGGTLISRRPTRSIKLADFQPILQLKGAHFISLQYDEHTEELRELAENQGVHIVHWEDALQDYDQTAALVAALDQVVSVCTAVIHLSGALGKKVWVLVPFNPEWRYGATGTSMPWYPSARLFRQEIPGEWQPVMNEVAGLLADQITQHFRSPL